MNLWIEDRVFYNIFTLGFCDVLEPSRIYEKKNRLIKIEEWIPHLKKMSINAIYFGRFLNLAIMDMIREII